MPIHGDANSALKVDSASCSPSNPSNVNAGFHAVSDMSFSLHQSIPPPSSSTGEPSGSRGTARCSESKNLLTANLNHRHRLTSSPSSTPPSASSPPSSESPPLVRGRQQSTASASVLNPSPSITGSTRSSQDLPVNLYHSESCFNQNHTHHQVFRSSSSSASQHPNCLQDIGPSFLNVSKNYSSESSYWQASHHSSYVFSSSSYSPLPVSCALRGSEFHPNLSMPVATFPKIDNHQNHRSSNRNVATLGSPNNVNTISGSGNSINNGLNDASNGSIVNGCQPGKQSKPRRRVATIAQRRAANIRERRRMFHLNTAFDKLRKKVPTFAYEKRLSRIETLRLAVMYISFMTDVLRNRTVI